MIRYEVRKIILIFRTSAHHGYNKVKSGGLSKIQVSSFDAMADEIARRKKKGKKALIIFSFRMMPFL